MAKINRPTGNLPPFASTATTDDRKVYGGATNSDELDDNLTAEFTEGWQSTTSPTIFPKLRDFNAFAFTATKLVAYLMQSGIAEYDSQQTYYIGSICRDATGGIFISLQDDNTGNALTNVSFWRDAVADGSITEDKLADDSVSLAKLAHIANAEYRTLGFSPSGVPQTLEAPLGVGQTLATYTVNSTRQNDTYYQNTTGRTIIVMISVSDLNTGGQDVYLGLLGSERLVYTMEDNANDTDGQTVFLIVPDNFRYKITLGTYNNYINKWHEIR